MIKSRRSNAKSRGSRVKSQESQIKRKVFLKIRVLFNISFGLSLIPIIQIHRYSKVDPGIYNRSVCTAVSLIFVIVSANADILLSSAKC